MQIVMSVLSAPVRSHLLWPSTRKRVALVAEDMMFRCRIGSLKICDPRSEQIAAAQSGSAPASIAPFAVDDTEIFSACGQFSESQAWHCSKPWECE